MSRNLARNTEKRGFLTVNLPSVKVRACCRNRHSLRSVRIKAKKRQVLNLVSSSQTNIIRSA